MFFAKRKQADYSYIKVFETNALYNNEEEGNER